MALSCAYHWQRGLAWPRPSSRQVGSWLDVLMHVSQPSSSDIASSWRSSSTWAQMALCASGSRVLRGLLLRHDVTPKRRLPALSKQSAKPCHCIKLANLLDSKCLIKLYLTESTSKGWRRPAAWVDQDACGGIIAAKVLHERAAGDCSGTPGIRGEPRPGVRGDAGVAGSIEQR